MAALVRFDPEMLEVRLPEPHPCPWDPLMRIGLVAEEAMTRYWGPGALTDLVDDMLLASGTSPAMARLLKSPMRARNEEDGSLAQTSLLPLSDMRRAVMGSVVNVLAHQLPDNEEKLASMIRDGHDELAARLVAEGIRGAHKSISDYLRRALEVTTSLTQMLETREGRVAKTKRPARRK